MAPGSLPIDDPWFSIAPSSLLRVAVKVAAWVAGKPGSGPSPEKLAGGAGGDELLAGAEDVDADRRARRRRSRSPARPRRCGPGRARRRGSRAARTSAPGRRPSPRRRRAVKTSASSPPSAAAIAATAATSRCTKTSSASAAAGGLELAPCPPEPPSAEQARLEVQRAVELVDARARARAAGRASAPGSTEPERVAIGTPSSGREAHRRVDRAAVEDRRDRAAAAEVADDEPRHRATRSAHDCDGEPVEAEAAHAPLLAPARGQRVRRRPRPGSSRGRPCRRPRPAARPGAPARASSIPRSAGALCSGASASSSAICARTLGVDQRPARGSARRRGRRGGRPPRRRAPRRATRPASRLVAVDEMELQARRAGVDDEDGQTQSRTARVVLAVLARVRAGARAARPPSPAAAARRGRRARARGRSRPSRGGSGRGR